MAIIEACINVRIIARDAEKLANRLFETTYKLRIIKDDEVVIFVTDGWVAAKNIAKIMRDILTTMQEGSHLLKFAHNEGAYINLGLTSDNGQGSLELKADILKRMGDLGINLDLDYYDLAAK